MEVSSDDILDTMLSIFFLHFISVPYERHCDSYFANEDIGLIEVK